jgi:hypothetical protein
LHPSASIIFWAIPATDEEILDSIGIAARLRGLIGGQEQGDLGAVASRLGVDEVSLRMSIDLLAPYPTLDVLSAVVKAYGVDPTWLVTGEYNSSTHRASETQPDRALDAMREMFGATPPAQPPVDPRTLRLLKDA